MEGASMLTGMVLLLAGGILLPTSEKNLGIIFMTCFWVPYGLHWYTARVCGRQMAIRKLPTAPVFTGPLPIAMPVAAVAADEDPV